MRRSLNIAVGLVVTMAAIALGHDLFLRPESFFVSPNSDVRVHVLNGTFSKSENAVSWDRIRDLSVVTPAGTMHPDSGSWSASGDTSVLTFRTGGEGTYLVAVSTRPRSLRLEAAQFNEYLATDGIPDILAARRRNRELNQPSRERYSKHVKALLQVGQRRTAGFDTVLGYPAELIALENPYERKVGSQLRVRVLVEGKPLANQFVLSGGRTPTGRRIEQRSTRSDTAGVARIRLTSRGQWYVKFIRMTRMQGDTVDYESKWATLTFEVR